MTPRLVRGLSVRLRLAAGATALFLLLSGLTSVVIVQAVRHRIEGRVRTDATEALLSVATQLEAGVPVGDVMVMGDPGTAVHVLDADGEPVAYAMSGSAAMTTVGAAGSFPGAAGVGPTRNTEQLVGGPIDSGGGAGVGIFVTRDVFRVSDVALVGGETFTLSAEHPMAEVRRGVDAVVDTLLVVTPLLSLGFGTIVWLFAGRALRPVDKMRIEVEEISHTTLHRRLTLPHARDEVYRLGHTMNGMLDRLEGAAERQRTFVSDASHDLRTPVSVVRANLEVALRADDADLLRTASQRALDANIRLQGIIDELLDLAQLDEPIEPMGDGDTHRPAVATRAMVDLEDVVFEDVAPRGSEPRIDVRAVEAARVAGDRAQLARVIGNLVDNAVAHARAAVRVGLTDSGEGACLVVDDDGPGVPAEARDAIFERFTRLEPARRGRSAGAGLGLSITHRIVQLHGATIEVTDAPDLGGARFVVRFPPAV